MVVKSTLALYHISSQLTQRKTVIFKIDTSLGLFFLLLLLLLSLFHLFICSIYLQRQRRRIHEKSFRFLFLLPLIRFKMKTLRNVISLAFYIHFGNGQRKYSQWIILNAVFYTNIWVINNFCTFCCFLVVLVVFCTFRRGYISMWLKIPCIIRYRHFYEYQFPSSSRSAIYKIGAYFKLELIYEPHSLELIFIYFVANMVLVNLCHLIIMNVFLLSKLFFDKHHKSESGSSDATS